MHRTGPHAWRGNRLHIVLCSMFSVRYSTIALYLFFRGSCLMFPVHSQFHVTFTLFFLQKSPKPCYICSRILLPKSCFIVVLFCTLLETLAKTLLLNSMWQDFWPFLSIWLNCSSHRALQVVHSHQSHTPKIYQLF